MQRYFKNIRHLVFIGGQCKSGLDERHYRQHQKTGAGLISVEKPGFLDTYQTGTGFLMLPVVSFVQPGFTLTPDENEVADIFEVPLHQALNTENYERHQVMWKGKQRTYYSMQYEGYNIWGATAGVLMHMSRRVTS